LNVFNIYISNPFFFICPNSFFIYTYIQLKEEEPDPSEEDDSEFAHHLSHPDAHSDHNHTTSARQQHSVVPQQIELSDAWRFHTTSQTVNGVLFVCLNIGVDPPDADRPAVCARMECWYEPDYTATAKSLSVIKTRLTEQYKRWHPKGRFRVCGDPTLVDLHKHCKNARKNAKLHRVLFHYNGHGVPMPTDTGEIWLFNSNYTKYIPLNLTDLQGLIGNPSLYVFDCNAAGRIVSYFRSTAGDIPFLGEDHLGNNGNASNGHDRDPYEPPPGLDGNDNEGPPENVESDPNSRDCVVLASCGENEKLPVDEKLPADLFTACLTTPIRTALYCYASRSLVTGITPEMIDRIPGTMDDRNTPLGDLARIYTTVSDTIAWSVLPRETFKRLFRQDLLLASMMRNFLLACRIMRKYGCTPQSIPELPESHNHPLWDAFDYTMEQYLAQLPSNFKMLTRVQSEREFREQYNTDSPYSEDLNVSGIHKASLLREESRMSGYLSTYTWYRQTIQPGYQVTAGPVLTHDMKYEPSTFFEDQIKAFEVWLDMADQSFPPQQLPILLLLLIQSNYRRKGLQLLSNFLQIGRKAVEEALSIGVFPYILSYLKPGNSNAAIMPELVLIWGKILAFDPKCKEDLATINAHIHFVNFLQPIHDSNPNRSGVHLAVAFFIVSIFGTHRELAVNCQRLGIREICLKRLHHDDPLVRRWACLCLTQILHNGEFNCNMVSELIHIADGIECVLRDGTPDVRAAGVCAIAEVLYRALRLQKSNQQAFRRLHSTETHNNINVNNNVNNNSNANSTPGSYGRLVQGEYPGFNRAPSMGSPQSQENPQACLRSYQRNQTTPDSSYNAFTYVPPPRSTNKPTRPSSGFDASPKSSLENKLVDQIGRAIARLGLINSSVLVRREVATALSHAAMISTEPFVAAANEFPGMTEEMLVRIRANTEQLPCYSEMWLTLLELALDPHPVVASHARASFDMISERMVGGGFSTSEGSSSTQGEALESPFSSFSPSAAYPIAGAVAADNGNNNNNASENRMTPTAEDMGTSRSGGLFGGDGTQPSSADGNHNNNINISTYGSDINSNRTRRQTVAFGRDFNSNRASPFATQQSKNDVIHVRGSSGTFNLNSVAPQGRIPRVNSASVINLNDTCGGEPKATSPRQIITNTSRDMNMIHHHGNNNGNGNIDDDLAFSPKFHLVASLMNLFRLSKPPQSISGRHTNGNNNSNINVLSNRAHNHIGVDRVASPPRVQRRSRSYQVLPPENSVLGSHSVSYERESNMQSALRRIHSSETADTSADDLSSGIRRAQRQLTVEKAVDSLFSWSCACMSKISVESTGPDHMPEAYPEQQYGYTDLWDSILRQNNEQYLSTGQSSLLRQATETAQEETMSANFTMVTDDESGINDHDDEYGHYMERDEYANEALDEDNSTGIVPNLKERRTHFMGAGGGAVVSLAFLPREIGREGDEYIVTGDSTGSVGVYDTQTGECQSSFGIPAPPGIPDVEVRAVLCLNAARDNTSGASAMENGDTPLILAGAYDGRVAVFRPDLVSKKYAVLSSFQASGRSLWTNFKRTQVFEEAEKNKRKAATSGTNTVRDEYAVPGNNDDADSTKKMKTLLHKSGNGLVMDFQAFNHSLYAAGCEHNVLRVWDLEKEMCSWEGGIASKGIWPTAICSPSWASFHTVVVGASDGSVTLIDTRTRVKEERLDVFGKHDDPIVSTAYGQWVGEGKGESIVSADCEGCIKIWDPRGTSTSIGTIRSEVKAHDTNLTAMAAHTSGHYIASGSTAKCVKVFRAKLGRPEMITHRNSAELLPGVGERMAPVTGLAFQTAPCSLAVGCSDSTVTIFDLE